MRVENFILVLLNFIKICYIRDEARKDRKDRNILCKAIIIIGTKEKASRNNYLFKQVRQLFTKSTSITRTIIRDFSIQHLFISLSLQLYVDSVPRGNVFPDSTQAISASGLKGGRSYEVAVVVFPIDKDEYKVAMSNLLV